MSQTMYTLTVKHVITETADTKSIVLNIPEEAKQAFTYKAGQYLTVEVVVNGETLRRAYSLSSATYEEGLKFSIKRVQGGKVSNYLNDQVNAGDTLSILAPEGKFVVLPEADKSKVHYFFAAGSGITPVMSMIKTLLEYEERSTIHLLYGSKTEDNIIFKTEFDALVAKHEGQLFVTHTLSQVKQSKGVFGFLKKNKDSAWSGLTGRIDADKINYYLREHPTHDKEAHYYVCGPGNLIQTVEQSLVAQGVPTKAIHKEYFTTDGAGKSKDVAGEGIVTVTLDGDTFTVNVSKEKTILESILDMDKSPPYSCTSGACASCMAKTTSGKVEMETCFSLDDEEIANGYILTCQSHPMSADVAITYDDL